MRTRFFKDPARTILSYNKSPDVGFNVSVNVYRGCEHGCVYCYARPTHEYLGFSAGLDFETRILVKEEAPVLLRKELSSKTWRPQPIAFSGNTDAYQPVERRLKLTRACLEVMSDMANPAIVITKNHLVSRDVELLADMARRRLISVAVSVTSLDTRLQKNLEPRTSTPAARLQAIRLLSEAGVPVRVLVAPVIPGLTDHEIPDILRAAATAGASQASYIMLRLPHGVGDLFQGWLQDHFPHRSNRVLNRIREMRDGQLYGAGFGLRMRGKGHYADQIQSLFQSCRSRYQLDRPGVELSCSQFRAARSRQPTLF